MTNDDIADRLRAVFATATRVPETRVVPTARLVEDLQLDSLDRIELVFEIEDAFGIEIPRELVGRIETFQDVVDGIRALMQAPQRASSGTASDVVPVSGRQKGLTA